MMRLPLTLHACSEGYQKPVPGNYEIPKPIYVSRVYEQHVAKNFFLLEGRNYEIALMQNQNYQKISNNLNSVSKTLEHKEPILFLPIDNFLTICFYFVISILYIVHCKFLRDYVFLHRAACKAIYV